MNIIEAAKQMKEGKRVRRKCWPTKSYIQDPCDDGCISFAYAAFPSHFHIEDLTTDDWEIVEANNDAAG